MISTIRATAAKVIKEELLKNDQISDVCVEEKDDELVVFITPKNKEEGYSLNMEKKKAKGWAMVYDISYSKTNKQTDPEFNTDLWVSNYDGLPIPEKDMKEWVNTTVERILSLNPTPSKQPSVLEIGCGSGLLLYPLLPHVSKYVGVDNAEEGLKLIQETCKGRQHAEKVKLYLADALTVAELPLEKFDIIVINSVTQYFPSMEYLVAVINGLKTMISDNGVIFLGDIRCSGMLEAFHSDTLLYKLDAEANVETLKKKINFKVTRDQETIFNPKLFHQLPKQFDFISSVTTQLRRGVCHNEMTRFRYDAILNCASIDQTDKEIGSLLELNWIKDSMTLEKVKALIDDNDSEHIVIKDIPNKRIIRSEKLIAMLSQIDASTSLETIKRQLEATVKKQEAYDPESFWKIANNKYSVEVDWNYDAWNGKMVVRLIRKNSCPFTYKGLALLLSDSSNKIVMDDKNAFLEEVKINLRKQLSEKLQPKEMYLISEDLFKLVRI